MGDRFTVYNDGTPVTKHKPPKCHEPTPLRAENLSRCDKFRPADFGRARFFSMVLPRNPSQIVSVWRIGNQKPPVTRRLRLDEPRFLFAEPFEQATRSDLICRKKLQLIRLALTCGGLGSIGQQEFDHARGHLVLELSTKDKVKHQADPKGFAIEAYDRLVCATLPLNEKDQRLAEDVPNISGDVVIGSGHQLRIMVAVAVPWRGTSI
jgi:hypothetical protein